MTKNNYLFTSESVSEGHPDKVCDRISDMVVDSYLARDPQLVSRHPGMLDRRAQAALDGMGDSLPEAVKGHWESLVDTLKAFFDGFSLHVEPSLNLLSLNFDNATGGAANAYYHLGVARALLRIHSLAPDAGTPGGSLRTPMASLCGSPVVRC